MTTGELDYSDTFQFGDEGDGISYNFMSNFLWIVFIVLMPILFANLLVSGLSEIHSYILLLLLLVKRFVKKVFSTEYKIQIY